MKKFLATALASLSLVIALPATTFAVSTPKTNISGVVTKNGTPLSSANVSVSCGAVSDTDVTDVDGTYLVTFEASDCPKASTATVTASKGGDTGSTSGTVSKVTTKLNVALVDVAVVPEMGVIAGGIAALTVTAGILINRRRHVGQL